MIQDEKKTVRKSRVATLLEEIDAIFIKHGLPKPVLAEPELTRHRIIVRMPRQNGSEVPLSA